MTLQMASSEVVKALKSPFWGPLSRIHTFMVDEFYSQAQFRSRASAMPNYFFYVTILLVTPPPLPPESTIPPKCIKIWNFGWHGRGTAEARRSNWALAKLCFVTEYCFISCMAHVFHCFLPLSQKGIVTLHRGGSTKFRYKG